jgi:hypothetical protein
MNAAFLERGSSSWQWVLIVAGILLTMMALAVVCL